MAVTGCTHDDYWDFRDIYPPSKPLKLENTLYGTFPHQPKVTEKPKKYVPKKISAKK